AALSSRLEGTNVDVVRGDATAMELPDDRFSGAVCLTMLHHVPSPAQQDQVFTELHRVLRPGGVLAGHARPATEEPEALHVDDTYVPVDPAALPARLTAAGFVDVDVNVNEYAVRFRAKKQDGGHGTT